MKSNRILIDVINRSFSITKSKQKKNQEKIQIQTLMGRRNNYNHKSIISLAIQIVNGFYSFVCH